MRLEKDIDIAVRDGAVLKANLFRPDAPGQFPVLVTLGPYGKDVHLSQFMPGAWEALKRRHPEILKASSCKHLVFETPDPEVWVPDGYIVLKVDSRGAGKSPGLLDVNSPAEFQDFYDVIEWAGVQPWSNGKVGLLGISYFGAGQWMIAAKKPPHLAAMIPWQGGSDFYRDRSRQGGIFCNGFVDRWWNNSVLRDQYGNPDTPFVDIVTGERNTGPAALSPQELAANRVDYPGKLRKHPLDNAFYRERSPVFENIEIPALVVANYGGLSLHLRGTVEGYQRIASREKWLKIQSGSYFLTFLLPQNVALQKRFFERYLKDIANGWEEEPRVDIALRGPGDTVLRQEIDTQWPLAKVQWRKLQLDAGALALSFDEIEDNASASYTALDEGLTFSTAPLAKTLEFAGPMRLRLYISSDTDDADIFASVRAFDAEGREQTFFGATEPKAPVTQGWLRVSQRKLDAAQSTDYRPYHAHDETQRLTPGDIYEVDVEVWPGSLSLPAGYRLALTIGGVDFQRADATGDQRGSGWFLHNDPQDRPAARFGGHCTLYTGPACESYLLLPVINA